MGKKKHKKANDFNICEYCGNEHDGSYGSGRFCSPTCSRRYSQTYITEDSRERQIKALTSPESREKIAQTRLKKKEIRENEPRIPKKNKKELKTNSTARIGKIGEFEVAAKFAKRDIPVYLPMTEAEEADMIVEFGGKLQKIQVKTSNQLCGVNNDAIKFSLTNSDHKVSHGKISPKNKTYNQNNVDYFALYSLPDDEVYLVKNDGIKTGICIRDEYPSTGQKANINLASDYNIDHVLDLIENGIDPDNIINCDDYIIEDE